MPISFLNNKIGCFCMIMVQYLQKQSKKAIFSENRHHKWKIITKKVTHRTNYCFYTITALWILSHFWVFKLNYRPFLRYMNFRPARLFNQIWYELLCEKFSIVKQIMGWRPNWIFFIKKLFLLNFLKYDLKENFSRWKSITLSCVIQSPIRENKYIILIT